MGDTLNPPRKSVIARDRERQPSTNHISQMGEITAYIAHRTRTRTYKNAQHTAAHATMDVRSLHTTNTRSTCFVLGKASEYRRRPRSYHVDPLSRRREVAHGVLCSSPKPEHTIFFASEQLGEKRDRDFSSSVFYTPADDTTSISIQNKPTVNALRVGQGQ